MQQALKDLDRAYRNFFEGLADSPRFRKTGNEDAVRPPQGVRLDQPNGQVFLPTIGWMCCLASRQVEGEIGREVEARVHPAASLFGINVGAARPLSAARQCLPRSAYLELAPARRAYVRDPIASRESGKSLHTEVDSDDIVSCVMAYREDLGGFVEEGDELVPLAAGENDAQEAGILRQRSIVVESDAAARDFEVQAVAFRAMQDFRRRRRSAAQAAVSRAMTAGERFGASRPSRAASASWKSQSRCRVGIGPAAAHPGCGCAAPTSAGWST